MDLFESIDDAAPAANDPVLSSAVAEVNKCYDELSTHPSDYKSVFDRLKKAAAIVRYKLAERDAKRDAGLSDESIKKAKELKVNTQVDSLMTSMDELAHSASEGDSTAR